jgi:hypothetical protein
MMAEVAHLDSVEQHITAAIKNSTNLGALAVLSPPMTSGWYYERYHENLYSLVVKVNN